MAETTKEKVKRLLTPQMLARIEIAGLMVIDKRDYEITMNSYGAVAAENRILKQQLKIQEGGLK